MTPLPEYKKKKKEEFDAQFKGLIESPPMSVATQTVLLSYLKSFLDTVIEETYLQGLKRGAIEMELIAENLHESGLTGFAQKIRKRITFILEKARTSVDEK